MGTRYIPPHKPSLKSGPRSPDITKPQSAPPEPLFEKVVKNVVEPVPVVQEKEVEAPAIVEQPVEKVAETVAAPAPDSTVRDAKKKRP